MTVFHFKSVEILIILSLNQAVNLNSNKDSFNHYHNESVGK